MTENDGITHVLKKTFYLKVISVLTLSVASAAYTQTSFADDSLSTSGKFVDASIDGKQIHCSLDISPTYAVQSTDGQSIMVSDRGYVLKSDLKNCQAGSNLHVKNIPDGVGFLSDINVPQGIYISLDFVSTQPMLYLATVAKIGTKRNLINLDGAYIVGKSINQLKKAAFSTSGDAGSSIISPDGRYVAADGQIDCSQDAYPGVWDVSKNSRVFADTDACNALFKQTK
ncbi:hypothetical protein C7401_15236 [Paraburkholderia unamae]|uniref:hypothetical protein n=1 Tax=Paraburkholderia unamae TaxID=219649 RepID=UPI000DC2A419|nr:hypothetical protein [Paraburkholderia unamae]RAR48284.1 hypothetical protein C7401_15236 [Paraburkholderia unamae]